MNRVLFLSVVLVVGAMASLAQAEFLTNGNFENTTGWGVPGDTTLPAGWTHEEVTPDRLNPAAMQTGINAIGGSGTSAFLPANYGVATADRRDMWNVVSTIGYDWVLQYDFACEDPGVYGDRSLSAAVEMSHVGTTYNRIIHRVTDKNAGDGYGDLEIFGVGVSYQLVFENAVQFDDDVSTTPVVNHITFTGHYDGSKQVYDVTLTNGLGTFTATNLSYYQFAISGASAHPVTGVDGCSFNTFNSKGDSLVDNVSLTVPEPGFMLLLTCGTMCLVAMRRRD